MSSTQDSGYSTALTFFHQTLRQQPEAVDIFRRTRGPVATYPWVKDSPVMQRVLEDVKDRHQDKFFWKSVRSAKRHMEAEQEALAARHAAIVTSPIWGAAPELARRLTEVLFVMSGDPVLGGPNVLASHRVLQATIEDVYGKRYSLKAVTWAWKWLEEHGILTVTPGVAYQGFGKARGTVYHLLPLNWEDTYYTSPSPGGCRACVVGVDAMRVRGAFRRAIEQVREEKRRQRYLWQGLEPDPVLDYSQLEALLAA